MHARIFFHTRARAEWFISSSQQFGLVQYLRRNCKRSVYIENSFFISFNVWINLSLRSLEKQHFIVCVEENRKRHGGGGGEWEVGCIMRIISLKIIIDGNRERNRKRAIKIAISVSQCLLTTTGQFRPKYSLQIHHHPFAAQRHHHDHPTHTERNSFQSLHIFILYIRTNDIGFAVLGSAADWTTLAKFALIAATRCCFVWQWRSTQRRSLPAIVPYIYYERSQSHHMIQCVRLKHKMNWAGSFSPIRLHIGSYS